MRNALIVVAVIAAFAFNQQIKSFFKAKPDPQEDHPAAAAAPAAPPPTAAYTPKAMAAQNSYVSPLDQRPSSDAQNSAPSTEAQLAAQQQAQAAALQKAKRQILSNLSSAAQ